MNLDHEVSHMNKKIWYFCQLNEILKKKHKKLHVTLSADSTPRPEQEPEIVFCKTWPTTLPRPLPSARNGRARDMQFTHPYLYTRRIYSLLAGEFSRSPESWRVASDFTCRITMDSSSSLIIFFTDPLKFFSF